MDKPPDLSLVIPLFNESKNVELVIMELREPFEKEGIDLQIILVNNGSSDDTGAIIDRLAEKHRGLKTLHLKKNQGYGGGILDGMECCDADHVGYTCGDGQISPEDHLAVYLKLKEGNYDISRVVRTARGDGAWRFLVTSVYHFFFPLFFGARLNDINAHPKMYVRKRFRELEVTHRDWFIDAEVMLKAGKRGYRIAEVPANFEARRHGRSNVRLKTVFEFAGNMIKYRFTSIERRKRDADGLVPDRLPTDSK